MVRTTIVLPEEDFRELKALAEGQDRSISWLLREAFRLSKGRLERPEPFAERFDRLWEEIHLSLHSAGLKPSGVSELIRAARDSKKRRASTGTRR